MINNRLVILLFYGAVIAVIVVYKETLLSWLSFEGLESLPWMIGAAVLLAMIPIVPYGIVAGIIGAAYGPFWGSLINVVSSSAASALTFWAVQILFHEQSRHHWTSNKVGARFIPLLKRNSFLAVLFARLLPFVPSLAVNIGAVIIRMPFRSFIIATLVGKVPVMIVFAFMGSQLDSSLSDMLWTLFIYTFFSGVRICLLSRVASLDEPFINRSCLKNNEERRGLIPVALLLFLHGSSVSTYFLHKS